jgi:hypothetical protein
MALPCTVLPCTEASNDPGLYRGLQLAVPSHRRELQTQVSTSAGLLSALANTAVSCIVLAPGTYILSAELNITRSVVLEAAVAGSVVLDAQASSSSLRRVLIIDAGSLGVVKMIGLNITGGYMNDGGGGGGGVYVQSGTVTMTSSSIYGNTAFNGGGVFVQSGTVSIVSSQIYSNTAAYGTSGGGVYVVGTVILSSCTITGNTAAYGGGVYISGTVTITSSSIYGNTATNWGGGVFVSSGTVMITSSSIHGNTASNGGGVYVQGGTVAISSCTIGGNTADQGPNGPNVNVDSCCGATVCSWATILTGVHGTVSTCEAPPPSLPPSSPPPPPSSPPPPDLALIPATIASNIPTAIAFVGTALTDGATCAFLPAGDDTCAGAAAGGLFPTGGVLSRGLVTVRLSGPMIYKLCAAPAGSDPNLDAHFTYVSSVPLTSLSPSQAMDIGPIAGGVGGGLLLLAGLCGLAWKLRLMKATPKSSGLDLQQEQGVVSPVRLLESDD